MEILRKKTNINKISYRLEFGTSKRATRDEVTWWRRVKSCERMRLQSDGGRWRMMKGAVGNCGKGLRVGMVTSG